MVTIVPKHPKLKNIFSKCFMDGKGRFVTNILVSGIILVITVYILYQIGNFVMDYHLNYRYTNTITNNFDLELLIRQNDKTNKKNGGDYIQLWHETKGESMGYNATHVRLPSIFDLEYNNLHWQTLRTSNGTFQLFGAYLDKRPKNALGPTVRILGMADRIEVTVATYCQFWFDGKNSPETAKSYGYKYIWNKFWGNYKQGILQPYLISCIIPSKFKNQVPQFISLVDKEFANATNLFRVIYDKPREKKDFAVCVKGLDYPYNDKSIRLIEWIELLNLLGADKIFFYELNVHPNIGKVLKYYEETGKIHVTPITLPGGQPNIPELQHLYLHEKLYHKRQNEVIPYNDCFYKHMYNYKYIILLDIDEVIMPVKFTTWKELMDKVLSKPRWYQIKEHASYNVRNVYFIDEFLHSHGWVRDIPKYMHMLQHIYRTNNFTKPGEYVKCFHNTEKVLTLHNHYPFSCLDGECTSYSIETKDAQLQHYREDCVSSLKQTCDKLKKNKILDTTVWKFKEPLISRVTDTLGRLQLFDNNSFSYVNDRTTTRGV